jgi:hypothetical protein
VVAILFIAPRSIWLKLGIERAGLVQRTHDAEKTGLPPPVWLGRIPGASSWLLEQWNTVLGTPGGVVDWLRHSEHGSLFGWARSLGRQVARRSVVLVFTLFALFFLYRDGEVLARQLSRLIQDSLGERGGLYVQHAIAAVRATVNGLVLVGLGEGVLIGIAYAISGVPSPAVWGAYRPAMMIPFAVAGVRRRRAGAGRTRRDGRGPRLGPIVLFVARLPCVRCLSVAHHCVSGAAGYLGRLKLLDLGLFRPVIMALATCCGE